MWKLKINLKENKIYNTALYCRLSLDEGSVGEENQEVFKYKRLYQRNFLKLINFCKHML